MTFVIWSVNLDLIKMTTVKAFLLFDVVFFSFSHMLLFWVRMLPKGLHPELVV